MTAHKPVTMRTYSEGKCTLTLVHRFVNALTLNGETNTQITIALFGNSLVDARNYNRFTTLRSTYPHQDLHDLLEAFKLRCVDIDNDDHAYLKFWSLRQDPKESVDDYYERMMKLASQFEVHPAKKFLLSNFRAGLLKYLQVVTVSLPRSRSRQSYQRVDFQKNPTLPRQLTDPTSRDESSAT